MEKKYEKKGNKAALFFKKNVYYIIMGVCVLAIAAMITITVVMKNKAGEVPTTDINEPVNTEPIADPDPTTDVPVDPTQGDPTDPMEPAPIVFASPVANQTIITDYVMDSLVWYSTLGEYRVHSGIDFGGSEGDPVYSAYDGVVESVTYDALEGNKVVVKHSDTLKTSYSSLGETVVTVGQTVGKGEAVGKMGVTATKEMTSGAHVHFEVTEGGSVVSPYDYLESSDK